jgi:anti-anti-sigma factor
MNDFTVRLDRVGHAAVVVIAGRLDGNTASVFNRFLIEHLAEDDVEVVFDVTGLEFISSAGLREFMVLLKRMDKKKARPAIFGVGTTVGLALEIAGFDVLFHRAKDRASAIKAVDRSATSNPGLLERLLHRAKPTAS